MNNRRLFLRGEGGGTYGMGHIMRLSAVAYHLSSLSFESLTFVMLESSYDVHSRLEKIGFQTMSFQYEESFFAELTPLDVVVVDKYEYLSDSLESIKKTGALLIYIDDTQSLNLSAVDIVINHTPGYHREDFKLSEATFLFVGPRYCMIRPEFIARKKVRTIHSIKRIVISLGMSESGKLLNNTLKLIKDNFPTAKLEVMPGSNRIEKDILSPSDTVHQFLSTIEMIDLFDMCDLGIFPMSTLYMEGLSRGMIVAGGYFVDNQKVVYDKLIDSKVVIGLGDFHELDELMLARSKKLIFSSIPQVVDIEYGEGWGEVRDAIKMLWR